MVESFMAKYLGALAWKVHDSGVDAFNEYSGRKIKGSDHYVRGICAFDASKHNAGH